MLTDQLLQELGKQFGLMVDWSNKNFIPYLKELAQRVVQYEFGQSIFWLVIGIISIIFGIIVFMLEIKSKINVGGLFLVLGIVLVFCGISIICCQIDDILLCKYLPEKILLRYAKQN